MLEFETIWIDGTSVQLKALSIALERKGFKWYKGHKLTEYFPKAAKCYILNIEAKYVRYSEFPHKNEDLSERRGKYMEFIECLNYLKNIK